MIRADSHNELNAQRLLHADPHVVAFHEQPLTMRHVLDGEVHLHYPDMVVQFEGSRELWEIKPASEAAAPANADRTRLLSAALPELGFAYRLISAEDLARPLRLSNVLTLLKCSQSRRFPGAYLTTWIRAIQRTSLFQLFRPL